MPGNRLFLGNRTFAKAFRRPSFSALFFVCSLFLHTWRGWPDAPGIRLPACCPLAIGLTCRLLQQVRVKVAAGTYSIPISGGVRLEHMENRRTDFVSPKLEARPLPAKGEYGVFTREAIAPGELLIVWSGNIVTGEQLAELPERMRSHSLQVDENCYQVPNGPTSVADLVNHSCSPNAGLAGQISLVAMRAIGPGEEICFDYAMSDGSHYDEFVCGCGSPQCRGRVTGNDWQLPELQRRYAGFFSPYLQRRIERRRVMQADLGVRRAVPTVLQ